MNMINVNNYNWSKSIFTSRENSYKKDKTQLRRVQSKIQVHLIFFALFLLPGETSFFFTAY